MQINRAVFRVAALVWAFAPAYQAGTVVLKNAFIEKYKNRATIDVRFEIDHAHEKPNKIGSDGADGDLQTSGRSPEIGLPMVVEVVNAAAAPQKTAIDLIHKVEVNNGTVPLSGAWRLWFEHPSTAAQIQGQDVPKPANTNPAHCFEIHPVTRIRGTSLLQSFIAIPKYEAYDAKTAFDFYESLKVTVEGNKSETTINAKRAIYNYAEFVAELTSGAQEVEDGYFALAHILDTEGATIVDKPRRLVFVKGTAAADAIKTARRGDRMHLLGIPRINLERIAFITAKTGRAQTTTRLPYEMIVVGVIPD